MSDDLLSYVLIIADDEHSIAPLLQLMPCHGIPRRMVWLIMHRAIAKDTDVRCIEKIRDAARFRNRLLRLVRQTMVPASQHVEEAALKV